MATLPPVRLEMLIDGTWVDLCATPARLDGDAPRSRLLWSDSGGPVEIVRGIAEDGGVAVGTLDCVLENNDGGLTPGRVGGPYYPHLVRGRRLRFSSFFGGAWRQRFGGFVWAEPLSWGNAVGTSCNVRLSAIDAIGMATKVLRSVAAEATAARSPLAYWPLTDGETTKAADQSGAAGPGLELRHYGADGGEISWAGGVALPTDNAGGLVLTPASEKGHYLSTSTGLDLPASWSLSVFPTPAAKDGWVVQVGTSSYSLGIWYDTSLKKLKAIETLLDSSGDPVDYVLATSDTTWAGGMESLTVTSTTVTLGSASVPGNRHSADQMLGSLVSVGGAMAVESGRARLYKGEVKHLSIWSGDLPDDLAADTLTGPSSMLTLSTAAAQVMAWSGVPVTVTTRGTDRTVLMLKTEGQTGADLLSQLARGSMARIFCSGDGGLVVAAWDHLPGAVVAPAGDIDSTGAEWGADGDEVRGATMTWPDGSTYTAGTSGGLDLPGVLASGAGRSVADWSVASSVGTPRFPDAPFELLAMSDAEAAALALTDVGSVLTVPGLPSQLPDPAQTGVVDAITETYGDAEWGVGFTTSADPRSGLMVVGDAVRGVVGAGWEAAPLGPMVGGSGTAWSAGEPVGAARLNASGYTGPSMQCGSFPGLAAPGTVTPIAVTFPTPFTSAPRVVAVADDEQMWSEVKAVTVSGVTTTGFILNVLRTAGGTVRFAWVATDA